jgi:SAM-dependent methyltransferase
VTGAGDSLDELYQTRFSDRDRRAKHALWREIGAYLQRWVDPTQPAIDVAADEGYFIANVQASERWATDVRDVSGSMPPGVQFVHASGLDLLEHVPARHFGTVFMSNYLEHLANQDQVERQLQVAAALLRDGGRVIVLQPNIRLTGPAYWDFVDHHVALTDRTLVESGNRAGLRTVQLIERFLPYTTKGRLPTNALLARWYLRIPLAWRFMGRQSLYIAERAPDPS